VIEFRCATFAYPDAPAPQLREVSVEVPEGDLALVVGHTGSGKSTLLNLVNGLVPHFTGGTLRGRVAVAGRSTADHPPRELADVVGVVRQDPQTGFVTDIVEDELAYTMESLALPPDVMRRRVEETLDLLDLAALRDRPLQTLSGGERQRVAIGAVLTAHPKVLVLDEPTSALDPQAAEEVLAAVQRLVHDLGLTVMISEHRLERVVQFADSVITVAADGTVSHDASPARAMRAAPVRPPIVALGLLAGWDPLPLSVRDARRAAVGLRHRLEGAVPLPPGTSTAAAKPLGGAAAPADSIGAADTTVSAASHLSGASAPLASDPAGASAPRPRAARSTAHGSTPAPPATPRPAGTGAAAAQTVAGARGVSLAYAGRTVLRGIDLTLRPGEVVALMGRNGAGKSSLLNLLAGQSAPDAGTVRVAGIDPVRLKGRDLVNTLGYVPQEPGMLLWAESVAAECAAADADTGRPTGTALGLLRQLTPAVDASAHPGDLSEGTRLALALAVVLAGDPGLLLLDEPTRGLDYPAKERLADVLRHRAGRGRTVVIATHDVELAAEACDRVVMLADADIVVDADSRGAVTSSPVFSPQTAKIMAPLPLLTVAEVRAALAELPDPPGVPL
jgi:energy-coupling factor transport system ATP-binding protein